MTSSFPESEDILSNIFKRLPVKSLRQCMHVNKQWYYLIQTSDFVNLHFNHQLSSPEDNYNYILFKIFSSDGSCLSLRYDDEQCQEYYKIQYPPRESVYKSSWKIYGISHGLICLSCLDSKRNILIWNPAIRKIKEIPASPVHFSNRSYTTSYTAGLVFGYFVKTNDFKAIKISIYYRTKNYERRSTHVDVYSLSSNSWETFTCNYDDLSFRYIFCIGDRSEFVNGSAFWVCNTLSRREDRLIRLNIENESIEEIELPTDPDNIFIRAWGKFLYLFDDKWPLTMWVLKGEGNVVWEKKKCIRHQGILLGFRNNGEMVLTRISESGFPSCDVDNESEEFAHIWPSLHISYAASTCQKTFYAFTESLVLLDDK